MRPMPTVDGLYRIIQPPRSQKKVAFAVTASVIFYLLVVHTIAYHNKEGALDTPIGFMITAIGRFFHHYAHGIWIAGNVLFVVFCVFMAWRYYSPIERALLLVKTITESLQSEATQPTTSQTPTSLIEALEGLASNAKEHARLRNDLHHQLDISRRVLARFNREKETILRTSSREMTAQYYAILGYANYLDEKIALHRDTVELRQDFDDASESAFTLKLIAGALDILRQDTPFNVQSQSVAKLMQHTLLALSANLDRRAMKLTTAAVNESVTVTTDATLIRHVLWMLLLGIIRHASPESTLSIGCYYNDTRTYAIVSIQVSELANGRLSPEEYGLQPPKTSQQFAETIRDHANIQLAELLLQRLDATISVIPHANHACEVTLALPA